MRRDPLPAPEPPYLSSAATDPVDGLGGQRGSLMAVRELRRHGRSGVLCLVVQTTGSTYRKAGALAAVVTEDGAQRGVISGGCLEPELAQAALRVLAARTPEIVVFDTRSDEDLIFGSGSGCRGRTSVLLVPVVAGRPSPLVDVLEQAGELGEVVHMAVALDGASRAHGWCWSRSAAVPLGTGPKELLALKDQASGEHRLVVDGHQTSCAVLAVRAAPRVLFVGAGPELPALVRIGREMGWHLTAIDHRAAAVATYAAQADVRIVARPAEGLARLAGQPHEAVVVMSHTAASDLEALRALSARTERYIGLLGPPARRDELMGQLEPQQRSALAHRLRSPVGFKLGGDGPEVLALSIAAELQQFLMTRG